MKIVFVLLVIVSVSAAADHPSDGERWLNWSGETRVAYIEGYIWGFDRGFYEGCEIGEKTYARKETGLPGEKCNAKIPNDQRTPEQYAEIITDYYRSYPGDQNVSILRLIVGLKHEPDLTIKQMHHDYLPSAKGPK